MRIKIIFILMLVFILFIASCTNTSDTNTNDVDLSNCAVYFDGCNTCGVEDGKLTSCTEKACTIFGKDTPTCLKTIE